SVNADVGVCRTFDGQLLLRQMTRTSLIRIGLLLCASIVLAIWWYTSGNASPSVETTQESEMTCDMGISAAKAARGGTVSVTVQPAVTNSQTAQPVNDSSRMKIPSPPGPAPEGMVWIPGGEFWMGAEEFSDAQPWHRVSVDGFWMDKTEVTNDQFAKFVKATKYVTLAEKAPRAEDFPGAPPENLVA